jgi:hypothetical protein
MAFSFRETRSKIVSYSVFKDVSSITESKSPEKVGAEKKLAAEPVKYHNYYGLGEDILLGIL